MRTLYFAALLALTAPAHADVQSPILGISLGQEFQGQFSECKGRRDNWCTLTSLLPGSLMPPDTNSPTALPTWVKRDRLFLEPNKGGKVDRFYLTTLGPQVQERVIESVTGRFGPPTVLDKQVKQNAMGVKVEVLFAQWNTADTVVVHECSQVNACTLFFSTAEAYSQLQERRKQELKRDKL
ncbi:MAG: hypothetical protein PSV40_15835 [Polaromonas sp.]|uniref:hypothetical protein n=1 Tax=Polaromonas sp. TaxID=1869339 RepID=UPI00248804BF|nr:hypothetical protein [Polaromonas sp.]MDI1270559.1 hypothetical protein [Polaromonas sp.]